MGISTLVSLNSFTLKFASNLKLHSRLPIIMKFISFMVATIAVLSTTVTSLEPCNEADIVALMNTKDGMKCITDTTAFEALDFETEEEKYKAICSFTACKSALQDLYKKIPNDCKTRNGSSLKKLTDPIYKACFH